RGENARVVALDVAAQDGFAAAEGVAVRAFDCSGAEPLAATLAWTDEPACNVSDKVLVDDLDLVLRAPDGTGYRRNVREPATGAALPGGRGDSFLTLEQVELPSPQPGRWTVSVRPVRGNFAREQGYALVVRGATLDPRGSSEKLSAPTTVTLRPIAGA